MDLSKLELVSTELLLAIKEKASSILASRPDNQVRVGRIGWFKATDGTIHHIRVNRINTKTISGTPVDPITHADLSSRRGLSWRVSPNLLNLVPQERAKSTPPATPYKPTSTSTASW